MCLCPDMGRGELHQDQWPDWNSAAVKFLRRYYYCCYYSGDQLMQTEHFAALMGS